MKIQINKRLSVRADNGRIILDVKNPAPDCRKFATYWLLNLCELHGIDLTPECNDELTRIWHSEPMTPQFKQYMNRVHVVRRVTVM